MKSIESYFSTIKSLIVFALLLLFPLFFLPFTNEFFITSKMYLLAFGSLLLILISTIELAVTRKIQWKKNIFDNVIFLLIISLSLSIIISSPNKIQALFQPNFGLISILALSVFFIYLSRTVKITKLSNLGVLSIASLIVSLITIIFFFKPFSNVSLSENFQFLNNSLFSPIGSPLNLMIFIGFFVFYSFLNLFHKKDKKSLMANIPLLLINLLALSLIVFTMIRDKSGVILPPLSLSWYGAVEVLKNPITAFFGVGLDNYASMFTKVKDFAYNQSDLWQISAFNTSSSTVLHILTEAGLFGLVAFILLLATMLKKTIKKNYVYLLTGIYLILVFILLPPSLISFFLLFVFLSQISVNKTQEGTEDMQSFNLSKFLPLYIGIVIVSFAFIGAGIYILGRFYTASFYFRSSLNAYAANNLNDTYTHLRQSIVINPFDEQARINFSHTNILIANNIAENVQKREEEQKEKEPPKEGEQQESPYTEEERQMITQAIQTAISEAKAAVSLNPQKALNWKNLAEIYRNVISAAEGADTWTVSSYQRAIMADPQNPIYRLDFGGLYYTYGNYDNAMRIFEQAITIKPNWDNAHYNLAWAAYQKEDYQTAALEMKNTLDLVDPKESKEDYEKVKKELEEFKAKLPKEGEQATEEAESKGEEKLNLPEAPKTELSPKIELPEESQPPIDNKEKVEEEE